MGVPSSTAAVFKSLSLLLCVYSAFILPQFNGALAADPVNVVTNLVLTPEDTFIKATWTLENHDWAAQTIEVSYAGEDGETTSCITSNTDVTNTDTCKDTASQQRPVLSPCTAYTVTVTPRGAAGTTYGVPASDAACTTGCTGGDSCLVLTTTTTIPQPTTTTTTLPTTTTTLQTAATTQQTTATTLKQTTKTQPTTTTTTQPTTTTTTQPPATTTTRTDPVVNVVTNLVLTPEDTFINANWTLENHDWAVQTIEVSYAGEDGETTSCSTSDTDVTNTDTCIVTAGHQPVLSPCTAYTVTVTPRGAAGITYGVPASDVACTTGCAGGDSCLVLTTTTTTTQPTTTTTTLPTTTATLQTAATTQPTTTTTLKPTTKTQPTTATTTQPTTTTTTQPPATTTTTAFPTGPRTVDVVLLSLIGVVSVLIIAFVATFYVKWDAVLKKLGLRGARKMPT